MVARELQKRGRFELAFGQAGDRVNHLAGATGLEFPDALDPADGCHAPPFFVEARRQFGAHGNAPRFDPAMPRIDRLRPLEIGRITRLVGNARFSGNP